jgi:hypothetical protein
MIVLKFGHQWLGKRHEGGIQQDFDDMAGPTAAELTSNLTLLDGLTNP